MINPQWLELPMSRTNFHGPKDVRAIEVRLYFDNVWHTDGYRQVLADKLAKCDFSLTEAKPRENVRIWKLAITFEP